MTNLYQRARDREMSGCSCMHARQLSKKFTLKYKYFILLFLGSTCQVIIQVFAGLYAQLRVGL